MPALPLALTIDRTATITLPTQISSAVRELIAAGRLPAGGWLPSVRALAADLGVSRSVTEQAYDQLTAEGWVQARPGAGFFVTDGATLRPPAPTPRPAAAPAARPLKRLDPGTPWMYPGQADAWRRAWRQVSILAPPAGYGDPAGLPPLREAIAARLGHLRGVGCDPAEVLITNGTTDAWRQLLTVLPPGPVAVEDPGYRAAVAVARSMRRPVRDLPAATPVSELTGVRAVYVTPAHQHPLGTVMPAADRVGLLAAARAARALVAEDDYDSEFRYDVAPVPALAGLDRDRVAYLGTAAKTVSPSLRLGWLVAPRHLTGELVRLREVTHAAPSWPVQVAFASLLADGYVDRAVRAARRVYAARAPLVREVLARLGPIGGPPAGMYVSVRTSAEQAVAAQSAAAEAGFEIPMLADYCRTEDLHGLVLGFGGCTEEELARVLAALAPVR